MAFTSFMPKRIGLEVDKPTYKRTFWCLLGFHKPSKFIIEIENGIPYFICKHCGERILILR